MVCKPFAAKGLVAKALNTFLPMFNTFIHLAVSLVPNRLCSLKRGSIVCIEHRRRRQTFWSLLVTTSSASWSIIVWFSRIVKRCRTRYYWPCCFCHFIDTDTAHHVQNVCRRCLCSTSSSPWIPYCTKQKNVADNNCVKSNANGLNRRGGSPSGPEEKLGFSLFIAHAILKAMVGMLPQPQPHQLRQNAC